MTHERLMEIKAQLLEAARDDVERLRGELERAVAHVLGMESRDDG